MMSFSLHNIIYSLDMLRNRSIPGLKDSLRATQLICRHETRPSESRHSACLYHTADHLLSVNCLFIFFHFNFPSTETSTNLCWPTYILGVGWGVQWYKCPPPLSANCEFSTDPGHLRFAPSQHETPSTWMLLPCLVGFVFFIWSYLKWEPRCKACTVSSRKITKSIFKRNIPSGPLSHSWFLPEDMPMRLSPKTQQVLSLHSSWGQSSSPNCTLLSIVPVIISPLRQTCIQLSLDPLAIRVWKTMLCFQEMLKTLIRLRKVVNKAITTYFK